MKMKQYEELLLKLIRCAVLQSEEDFGNFSDFSDWGNLFALCRAHSLTGAVYDKLSEVFDGRIPEKYAMWFRQTAFKEMSYQAVRSVAFLNVYDALSKKGITPVVLKGEALRALYPQPESRTSLDEDLLVEKKDYKKLVEELEAAGFEEVDPGGDDKHWVNKKFSVYFEVHFKPFADEKIYEKWNGVFEKSLEKTVKNPNGIVALSRTDGLIFLILHAAKHFVYSGVGIKQILDIALFIKNYKKEIDFQYVRSALKKTKALKFAQQLMAFIKEYLYGGFYFFGEETADDDFVRDILESGSLGKADEERIHSANVTAGAFKGKSSIKKILFPPAERLRKKYPFCRKFPILLPAAWLMRIVSYLLRGKKSTALKTGSERLKMLRKYGLINK